MGPQPSPSGGWCGGSAEAPAFLPPDIAATEAASTMDELESLRVRACALS